jgi:hypothetical protein
MDMPLDESEVAAVVGRVLGAGELTRLPKRRSDLEILLALAAALFEAGRLYREDEVNERLRAWLQRFASPRQLDHVSLRRALVDLRYLLRDAPGSAYQCNPAKISARLTDAARGVDPGAIHEMRLRERAERKQRRTR